jgi:hypothetical protein
VDGEVTTPATYSTAQLAGLPQTTETVTLGNRQVTYTGVLLETLVTTAKPATRRLPRAAWSIGCCTAEVAWRTETRFTPAGDVRSVPGGAPVTIGGGRSAVSV